ncbi:MAG: lysoplasmalogenase [Deltaproteobacteria bacterium]|nr:lysoplasmalogenase [Deltaproteobacteria bacterium]
MLGLIFSLAGDVFLMLPSDRFLPGLASFLVAHLLYIAAFSQIEGFQLSLSALAPFALASAALLRLLWPHLAGMQIPVLVYVVVIVTMGWQATAQWSSVGETWALLALVGAIFFTISDAALALNRFRAAFASAPATILSSYYLAQWLIALSVAR